jgi:two-component system, chemotaxis family, protein-glutamate methylesterase/glutaminase
VTLPVVIVDDSGTRRAALRHMLEDDSDIRVVGEGSDPETALAAVNAHAPAVVTMDLEMPGGGGQHAIERIMAVRPVPILVLSSHVRGPGSLRALDALSAGALEVFPWPDTWDSRTVAELRERLHVLEGVTVMRHPRGIRPPRPAPRPPAGITSVIGIAASTGGPPALATLLSGLVGVGAPILVVQHLHADFLEPFVNWMTRAAGTSVVLAVDGTMPRPDTVYVAPSDTHLRLSPGRRLALSASPVRLHTPSADELFESIATSVGARGVGVVLTGMGDDGARGLLALRKAGGLTIAQDEQSSAVWGMPGAAWRCGAAARLVPLADIAGTLLRRAPATA